MFLIPAWKKVFPQSSQAGVEIFFPGKEYQVEVVRLGENNPGETLLLIGGIHGDELAGCLTVERYTRLSLKHGRMIIIPRLNRRAILAGCRGINGVDMNRLFALPEEKLPAPEGFVIQLVKKLIQEATCVVNTHQGSGFFSPVWVDSKRNPRRWGQCNVIDAPFFDLPRGERISLQDFAQSVASRTNLKISDARYHFQINNTETASENSRYKEQRKSLTYYALTKAHRMAVAVEVTKDCSLSQAVSFMTLAINAVLKELGIIPVCFPEAALPQVKKELSRQSFLTALKVGVSGKETRLLKGSSLFLSPGQTLRIEGVESYSPLGWSFYLQDFRQEIFPGRDIRLEKDTVLEVAKDNVRYGFPVRISTVQIAGLQVSINGQERIYHLGETILLLPGEDLKVTRVLPENLGSVKVDIKGFAGNQQHNDGQDLGYLVKREKLLPRFALNQEKTLYRIEVKSNEKLVGELFLQLQF